MAGAVVRQVGYCRACAVVRQVGYFRVGAAVRQVGYCRVGAVVRQMGYCMARAIVYGIFISPKVTELNAKVFTPGLSKFKFFLKIV